ncbi:TetR/AcrR family transcriptional regulator [Actinomadura rubrisoli]|uniref:TetR/AcrR family transcriptional regulator n=1 Tax=Actinomadura rubrisoli TaxID=2530368 RepID=A0A4R5BAL9_9ACTN|nr:TetR/AcrR family transcriptional regulator [Actinomadura rubrisoli]TDD81676.1 TetR/AcrR family transcriptional regulator [Actinomadura rubrisoli]
METAGAPPHGTRPRNRRELIIAAAADLFHRNGYRQVSVSDVAGAVNVRPSALYRHFPGKARLLAVVVLAELQPFRDVVADRPLDGMLPDLVRAALDHPRLGVLWQREARALPADEHAMIRDELDALNGHLASALLAARPALDPSDAELLAWTGWAVLQIVGHHSVELPKGEYASLLEKLVRTVFAATPSPDLPQPEAVQGFAPQARRERLLAAAVPLFAAHGYNGISMEDIGAAAGISGPSVYHHFRSKQELLYTALVRSDEWLRHDMMRALAAASNAEDALRRLSDSYVDFAVDHITFIDILLSEARHLSDDQRPRATQSQQEYLAEWLHLLREIRPEMPVMQARARVHAALAVINDFAFNRQLRQRPNAMPTIKHLAELILLGT